MNTLASNPLSHKKQQLGTCSRDCLLKGMWHQSPKLLLWRKCNSRVIITPHVTLSISVCGSCSPTFAEIEGLHLKAARVIYRLPRHVMDSDGLQRVHWQNVRHIHKRKLAIEMFKAKHNLSRLPPHVKIVASRWKGRRRTWN